MGAPVSVVAVPVSDTVKEVIDRLVRRTIPRETLVEARGPWIFTRDALVDALARSTNHESQVRQLVALCEIARLRVRVLPEP